MAKGQGRVGDGGWKGLVAGEGAWSLTGTGDPPPQRQTGKMFVGLRREVVWRCSEGGEEERRIVNE